MNRELYASPLMRDLCYRDDGYRWHALVRQARPHEGLYEFSGWYGTAREFMDTGEGAFLAELEEGCRRVGRSGRSSATSPRWARLDGKTGNARLNSA